MGHSTEQNWSDNDNGSNMLKAFCQHLDQVEDREEEDEHEEESITFEEDERDFDSKEIDHDITFKFFGSCLAHTLQRLMKKMLTSKH